jgi:hypothetical protein
MVDLVLVAIALVLVVGLIQYLKKVWVKAPGWVWKVALPVLSVVIFLVLSLLPPWLVGIALVIAGGQLFYEVVVKFIEKIREKLAK